MLVKPRNNMVDIGRGAVDIAIEITNKICNAFHQLRYDQKQQQGKDQEQGEIGKDQRNTAAQAMWVDFVKKSALKKTEKGIEEIGKCEAD